MGQLDETMHISTKIMDSGKKSPINVHVLHDEGSTSKRSGILSKRNHKGGYD